MNGLGKVSREVPVLIAGPTASGKSALAMELAARDGRVIVNADALQVYRCWRVLTARPSAAEEAALTHALFGQVEREAAWSVGHWLRAVGPLLDGPVVIVGGTGLYFRALTEGLAEVPTIPSEVRAAGDALRVGDMDRMRAEVDAATRTRIDMANPVRVQRAWEVLRATGRGLAVWQDAGARAILPLGRAEAMVLRPEVGWLNARIEARFSAMLAGGALDEVAAELPDWRDEMPYARAIGARELVGYLRGESDLAGATAAAVTATRQYAKRQRTWLRSHMKDWRALVPE